MREFMVKTENGKIKHENMNHSSASCQQTWLTPLGNPLPSCRGDRG